MKKILIVVFMCACVCVCVASKGKPTKRSAKTLSPMSMERVAEIASYLPAVPSAPCALITDRKAWGRLAKLKSASGCIRRAKRILKQPIPECPDELYLEYTKIGNRRNYERPYFSRKSNMETLAVAECLENKGRFLPKLCQYLETICAERSWTMPAHDYGLKTFNGQFFNVELGSSARARSCAWIVSAMYDVLPKELSSKVKSEIEKRIFSTYRKYWNRKTGFRPLHWFIGSANWTAVCHCEVVCAALAIIDDRIERAKFIETAERCLPFFIAGFPSDGYCSEGMGYWNYGWGHYLRIGLVVKQATSGKIDFFSDPQTKTIMALGTGFQMVEGKGADFADGGGHVADNTLLLGHMQWPDFPVNSSTVGRDLLFGGPTVFFLRAFGQFDGIAAPRAGKMPIRNEFPVGQVWVFRQNPNIDKTPFSVSVKGGHNAEFHNHNDVGSYAVMLGNVMMSGDPGGTQYTARTFSKKRYTIPLLTSYGHPVPVLNGCHQEPGRKYAAKILSTDFSDGKDTVVMDLARAYLTNANVRSVVRTFEYNRKGRKFSVTDNVTFKAKGTFSVPVLTSGIVEPCNEKGKYRLKVGTGAKARECGLSISVAGSGWKLSEGERIDNPNRVSPMRYAVVLDNPVKKAQIKVIFSADDNE